MSYLRLLSGLLFALVVFALVVTVYQPLAYAAASTSYSFENITHINSGAEADGEANLKVEVIDLGGSQVQFRFINNIISFLTDVYFAPVPEPGTYAMLLAGFCVIGAITRRRKPTDSL